MSTEYWWNDRAENPILRENLSQCTMNPTWRGLTSNPGLHHERQANTHLSYGTAKNNDTLRYRSSSITGTWQYQYYIHNETKS
jgi:hypothetical protein